ncbi:hypothetical protein M493_16570 [Geobacillus genomosp. 3]|uniref:Uncharacterized protein n=1 Tax=Geobacillus genomosp. 3 TaxID=1921421 RepID=S6A3Y6_GEOG3|nr:hypothetical protein M493_16570 [Geobacillus genomosp. 3]
MASLFGPFHTDNKVNQKVLARFWWRQVQQGQKGSAPALPFAVKEQVGQC